MTGGAGPGADAVAPPRALALAQGVAVFRREAGAPPTPPPPSREPCAALSRLAAPSRRPQHHRRGAPAARCLDKSPALSRVPLARRDRSHRGRDRASHPVYTLSLIHI
eukprot:4258539-Prymnesium_polylepis.1